MATGSGRPNIVLITLDAVRADRASSHGYQYNTTPNINRLLRNAYNPKASYAVSPCTFGSFPSIMTSTRPLSYGGFDNGIANRPPSVTATLRASGYRTTHITTVHWANSFFGYEVETEELLIEPATLTRSIGIIVERHVATWTAKGGDAAELHGRIAPLIDLFFEHIQRYCRDRLADRRDFHHANNKFDHQHFRWNAVLDALASLEGAWRTDPGGFIAGIVGNIERGGGWLEQLNWRRFRTLPDKLEAAVGEAVFRVAGRIRPSLADPWNFRRKKFPDAETIVDRILLAADEAQTSGRPFFVWGHMFDAHLPYCAGSGHGWAADTRRWLAAVGHDPDSDPYAGHRDRPRSAADWAAWNAIYDAAIGYMDHHVGRLKRELEARGLGNTAIVLTNDHGEEMGEHGDTAHKFRLWEHNTRTHSVVYHPDLGETSVPGLCTLMDIAPTIADLAGVPPPAGWEGRSYADLLAAPREEVVMETFFGSPCDVEHRPVYFAVRRGDLKLIWCERVDSHDKLSKPGAQLFDLALDPNEQNNIAAERPGEVKTLMGPILDRYAELRAEAGLAPDPPQGQHVALAAA